MSAKRYAIVCLLALAVCEPALAHSPIKGIGNFYNGLLHPLFVPAHLLLLIALGLLIGQKGIYENRAAVAVFLVTTAIGLFGAWFSIGGEMEILLLSAAAIIGLLIASNLSIGNYLSAIIAALVGFFIGIDSAQETLSGKVKLVTLIGSGVGIYLLLLYSMGFADYFNKKLWQKIGVRVIGSWVAASSLLVLALSFSLVSSK
jgi:urease accessory protein